jgi:pimeloyl-ACP methyl ester carboxylesterase
MQPTLVLIPSPLLGPTTWEPVGRVLERKGRHVQVPSLRCVAESAPPYWPAGVAAIVAAAGEDPLVLVPHSNSGLYVPAVVSALGEQVRGVVFVDAALPEAGYFAPREFLDRLVGADGLLPRWTDWWDEFDAAGLFPDAGTRALVEAEQPRMPIAYYDHRPPAPPWEDGNEPPCAYLWFAPPYDTTAERAAAHGWATGHLAGQHLHMLVDPDAVAAAVLGLAGEWH